MSYLLRCDAPLGDELRRVAREQLKKAVADLESDPAEIDDGIHQARKRCKKLRGLLRLARDPLGRDYGRLNDRLRDTAGSLSRLRDATALIESVDHLVDDDDADDLQDAAAALRQQLEHGRSQAAADQDQEALVRGAACELRVLAKRVDDWPLDDKLDIDDLMPGLEQTYRRGREALTEAQDGDAEAVHEWRKRAKYLWYHVRLLRACWKRPLKSLADELDELGMLLGDHHDLANLQQVLSELRSTAAMEHHDLQVLEQAITERSAQLLATALPIGARIWTEKPTRFISRIRAYWAAWADQMDPHRFR